MKNIKYILALLLLLSFTIGDASARGIKDNSKKIDKLEKNWAKINRKAFSCKKNSDCTIISTPKCLASVGCSPPCGFFAYNTVSVNNKYKDKYFSTIDQLEKLKCDTICLECVGPLIRDIKQEVVKGCEKHLYPEKMPEGACKNNICSVNWIETSSKIKKQKDISLVECLISSINNTDKDFSNYQAHYNLSLITEESFGSDKKMWDKWWKKAKNQFKAKNIEWNGLFRKSELKASELNLQNL